MTNLIPKDKVLATHIKWCDLYLGDVATEQLTKFSKCWRRNRWVALLAY